MNFWIHCQAGLASFASEEMGGCSVVSGVYGSSAARIFYLHLLTIPLPDLEDGKRSSSRRGVPKDALCRPHIPGTKPFYAFHSFCIDSRLLKSRPETLCQEFVPCRLRQGDPQRPARAWPQERRPAAHMDAKAKKISGSFCNLGTPFRGPCMGDPSILVP